MRFEIYSRWGWLGQRWYWRLRAANNEIVAVGEAYNSPAGALHAVDLVQGTDSSTPIRQLVA